jgi:hypothetical protein
VVDLSALGSTTCGVWTRADARRLLPASTIRARLRDGSWQRLWPGVYADTGELTAEQRCWAAVLVSGGPTAVACGRTAARCWGLPLVDDRDPATGAREQRLDEVIAPAHRRTLHFDDRELRRHRFVVRDGDVLHTPAGLAITSALRTLVDCSSLLTPEAAVCVIDDALHRGLVQHDRLVSAAVGARGRPGAVALTAAVAVADGRAESPFETLTRLLLRPVLPDLEPQVELRDPEGRVVARFDLADRHRRFAVESDGTVAHAGPQMLARDRRRDERTEELGWRTERVTWYDVRCRPEQTRARVLRRAAQHSS